jgi:hypothetical protein
MPGSRRTLAALLAGTTAIFAGAAAVAQDLGGALNLGQLGATIGVSHALRDQVARTPRAAPSRTAPSDAPTTRMRPAMMTFRADPARQKATVGKWLARIGKADPASAQQFGRSFERQSLTQMAGPWLSRYGMRTDNGADAAAAYLSTAWLISRGNGGDPSRVQITGLRDQLARAISATPGWVSASEAARQEFADTLLLQATVNGALLEGARGNQQRTRAVSNAVASGAESAFGIDVRRLELTSNGLVPSD